MSDEGLAVGDFKFLHQLQRQSQLDAKKNLPEVAKQFEIIFLKSMIQHMRASHFVDENSLFRGRNAETFGEMLDSQFAGKMAQHGGIGLASMLTKQLSKSLPVSQDELNKLTAAEPKKAMASPASFSTFIPKVTTEAKGVVDEFVNKMWPFARVAAQTLGLDPKILLAQVALETSWGQSIIKDKDGNSTNNAFNMKSNESQSDVVDVKTTEFIANTPMTVNAKFKKYNTLMNSFNDYVSLIQKSERYSGALANAQNPAQYVQALQEAGYATDPNYKDKILSIYHGSALEQALERNHLT